MAFEQEPTLTPTYVGRMTIRFDDDARFPITTGVTFTALDTPESHLQKEIVSGTLSARNGFGQTFVENTDYQVNYTTGEVTCLSGGAMVVDTEYLFDYKYHYQDARYIIELKDQNEEEYATRRGSLAPHITTQERDALINFLNTLRARAELEILG